MAGNRLAKSGYQNVIHPGFLASYDLPLLTGEGVGIGTGLSAEDGAAISAYWLSETASIMNHAHSLINA